MDRALSAFVHLDVPADTVRIDVRGTLTHESRPDLIHIIRRIRRMGLRSHIRVDLSQAALVESPALAGLRADLTAMDVHATPGISSPGVSLHLTPAAETAALPAAPVARPLVLVDDDGPFLLLDRMDEFPDLPAAKLEELFGRALVEYSDEELLDASDSLFALLDNPSAFGGPDLLGRYNDIGQEILRRQQDPQEPFPAAEGQAAS
ncbi:hypothetical protein FDW83_13755 [Pseudarthrobacter sp. NamE2]|uniref:hypothetical protein n=1 Tax=Pseudarthrobacter sp. NamE2 TaxID=2576838 RepID=UPI0010FE2508|nr:hypothetical protein [Pseudarthrobacter sp. NamE2]TLM82181.1 hypothetical protein FDW83_13755 [Pseudarthrobacter sp. NamE2]